PRLAPRPGRRCARHPGRDGPISTSSCDARATRGARRRRAATGEGGGSVSFDPDTTRIVRSWLDEGVTQLPDRVLDAVLDQVPATPQRRVTWWPARRLSTMNTTLKFGLAAVVVAVAALIGINSLGTPSNVGGPGPAPDPTVEPTPLPEPSP